MNLYHLGCKKFIGDLSLEDADVLAKHGGLSSSILEFGVGGSTQILAQCNPERLVCVDTDPEWIEATQNKLNTIAYKTDPTFLAYGQTPQGQFDMIFVDGAPDKRLQFAQDHWHLLKDGGVMLFHDTRRFEYFKDAAYVAQLYFNQIAHIEVNAKASNGHSSNITVIYKKAEEPYVNWNYTEGKPLWAYGTKDKDLPLWQQS